MAMPNDAPSFPAGVSLTLLSGIAQPSSALVSLLVKAREDYDWPFNTGKSKSQQRIIDLEKKVAGLLKALTQASAHQIIIEVSSWAGNNKRSHTRILNATNAEQQAMLVAVQHCLSAGGCHSGLDALSQLQGVSLVIASKIYRLLKPKEGAAVDRHASYFFNSLALTGSGTAFLREWPTKARKSTRLATFSDSRLRQNLIEYIDVYLPLLSSIASGLNHSKHFYQCAASGQAKSWSAADVEMAAYYWWARNGEK